MFCKNCGDAVEEGSAFCRTCGAPVTGQALGAEPAPPASVPPLAPMSPPPVSAYGPGWQPPQGPRRQRNGGLIIGIVAAVIIVLAGAGVGVYFGFLRDKGGTAADTEATISTVTTVASSSTSTSGTTTSTGGQTTSSANGSTTFQTIPSLTTTTAGPSSTGTTLDATADYLSAQDAVVMNLEQDDQRIPELATQINDAAPNVPKSVRDELQSMLDVLDKNDMALASFERPQEFDEAFSWLQEAVMHMVNRIQATMQGIQAMWDTGKISSSTPFFDTGRVERDAYRSALQKYHDVLPIE